MKMIEINEAFASVVLAYKIGNGADTEIININGGTIALAHPLCATGAILKTKLVPSMHDPKYFVL